MAHLPNGRRLLALRELLGLTQTDLAGTLGVSQPMLSKIEKAERPITPDLIDQAAACYDLPRSFFHVPPGLLDVSVPTFRKTSTAKASDERRIVRCYREAARIYADVSQTAGYHTNQIPEDLASQNADDAATSLRASAGLDIEAPIPNMTRFLERLGIGVIAQLDVTTTDIGHHLGVSIPAAIPSRPLIALVHDLPGAVARFTLAHELAHHIWDRETIQPWTSRRAPQEQHAHAFAAALLLPTTVIKQRISEDLNLNAYLRIKADYGISVSAIITAAKRTGAISPERARSLYIQHSARGWRTNEPVPVAAEHPILLKQCLQRITAWDTTAIAETTAMPAEVIARWTGQEIPPSAPVINLHQWRQTTPRLHGR